MEDVNKRRRTFLSLPLQEINSRGKFAYIGHFQLIGINGTRILASTTATFFHLRNIFKIRKFLSYDTCKTLIHAFVTARIDYCNSLLYGQPKCILKRLQSVLNSAARLIHLTSRYEHVTPLLIQLHWLPVEQRITFKLK